MILVIKIKQKVEHLGPQKQRTKKKLSGLLRQTKMKPLGPLTQRTKQKLLGPLK